MTINNDNVFTDESVAPIATVPSTLTADQLVELHDAQQDEGAVHTQGTAYQRSRALAYRNRHRFVASVSPAALAYHVEKAMDYKVDGLRLTGIDREYQIAAMGILQLDVLRAVTKSDKADQNNRISDLRRALESLNHFASAIEDMTDDEFVTWFAGKGGLDGIHREFRAANPVEVEPVRDDKKIRTAIDAMIANSNAVEVDNPGLATGIRLFVARGEGGKLRMVPLDASADFIASLSDRAPDPMTNTPSRVVLFRELLLTASRIVPDVISDVPKRPLRPGEQVSATTEMLPANHIVCVRGGVFSIAGSRVEDTIVVEVEPSDEKLARILTGEGFIDTVTRKNMLSRLEPTSTAAGYTGVTVADAESKNGPEVRVSFERGENKVDGQLIVKTINRMGGLHTWRVKAFKATASATIDAAGRKAFNERFLAHVIKARDDHAVSITIDAKGLGFQLGSAKTATVPVLDTSGEETVRVAKADFLRAVNGLLALPLNDAIIWSVDPRGLLRIEAYTASATYRVGAQMETALNGAHPGLWNAIADFINKMEWQSRTQTYLTSLSAHDPEHLLGRLSMWRAYGGPTSGVALIFNTEVFQNDAGQLNTFSSPVAYGNEALMFSHLKEVADGLTANIELIKQVSFQNAQSIITNALQFATLSFKHPAFIEEQEWRVIHRPLTDPSPFIQTSIETVRGIPQMICKVPLMDQAGLGMPWMSLDRLLHSIIIGPCVYPQQVAWAFGEILRSIGIDPADKISIAAIPLRQQG